MSSSPWHDRTLCWLVILLLLCTLAVILAAMVFSSSTLPAAREPVNIRILAVNDFHGQLPPGKTLNSHPVGSAPVLASYLNAATASAGTTETIIALPGDVVGASPPESGLLLDEPTMVYFNLFANPSCGPAWQPENPACNIVATLGNHEFDQGSGELMRKIYGENGGTTIPHIIDPYPGTRSTYICANVVWKSNNTPILPPYTVKTVDRIPIAFIGADTMSTPSIQKAANVADVTFLDEADSINRQVSVLQQQGIHAFVILLHEGGSQDPYDGSTREGTNVTGRVTEIVSLLDGDVDVVLSGHTHEFTNAYLSNSAGNPVLVTQAYSYSMAFAEVDLVLDPATGDIVRKTARIIPAYADVPPGTTPDPEASLLLNASEILVGPSINQVVGTAATDITREQDAAGESALGDLVVDAQRNAMLADVCFLSSGSIRDDVSAGNITWGDLYAVQPFSGTVQSMTITGEQVKQVLEQQWQTPTPPHNLMVSGLVYTYDAAQPPGNKVTDVKVKGVPLDRNAHYTAAMVDFLAGGGDRYTVFTEGTNITSGGVDVDVLTSYVASLPQPVNVTIDGRIWRIN
jgi:5'-nucleotidase